MREVVLLEPDPAVAAQVRRLLEAGGLRVLPAANPEETRDALRGAEGAVLLSTARALEADPGLAGELSRARPDVELVAHPEWAAALVEEGPRTAELQGLARGALLLLCRLAEQHAGKPAAAERAARLAGLAALRMGLSPGRARRTELVAALGALGPVLVRFKLAAQADPFEGGWGVSDALQASLAAAAFLGAPTEVTEGLLGLEERFAGGGRPRGLAGEAIPPESRAAAAALAWARLRAEHDETAAAAALAEQRGAALEPRAVDALMRALRAESLASAAPARGTGARVLLADGDETALALTELRLGQAGFAVTVHRDGPAACEAALAAPPDVIVADLALPRLDGVALLLRLRRAEETARVPVLLLSARSDPATLQRALKLGAKDILPKPLDHELLLAKLRALTGVKAAAGPAVQGDLAELPLEELFQALHLGRRTARIAVESRRGKAEVFFQEGEIVATFTADRREGEAALLDVLAWSEGSFRVAAGEYPPGKNVTSSFQAILLRAAKAKDDAARAGGASP